MTEVLVQPADIESVDYSLVSRSRDLNEGGGIIDRIIGTRKARPIARYVSRRDIPSPPAPAWYIPAANDIYIHVDEAGIKGAVEQIDWYRATETKSVDMARILGLFCHETGHAAISDQMTPVQMGAKHHWDLLTLLEELRVENYALRRAPEARPFLRASFGLVLENLPDKFENKSHIVRAWAIARGRTLAGVAGEDETAGVDVAARTLLTDEVVDGLTDLLQETLTLRLDQDEAKTRMVEICDEWVALVGETAESTGCTHCAREAEPGEEPTSHKKAAPSDEETEDEPEDGEAEGGGGEPEPEEETGDDGDGDGSGSGEPDGTTEAPPAGPTSNGGDDGDTDTESGTWGNPGDYGDEQPDEDLEVTDKLTDEDSELMSMLARDLADLMTEEWLGDKGGVQLSNSREWAATVFGNRKKSKRLTQVEPSNLMRQEVVKVASALSTLSLPTITKTAKASEVPPGRLRSREALRASAERAQGKMVTARPWKGTQRRTATARPLVIGVATDTSGSMRWATEGVAEFAYVYTNAGHRVGARTAAVTFGDDVQRIARPGEVMTHVQRKQASDGTERFDWAMAALDGVLHLTDPAYAARILLVVSDGAFVQSGESAKSTEWLRRMDKAGTHVLWIGDRDLSSYGVWLPRIAKQLDHVTLVDVESISSRRGDKRVFDLLNDAALNAIRTDLC